MPTETFIGVTLARILRPRGLHGEVSAEILTDFPERLTRLQEVWLSGGRSAPRRMAVERCWLSPSRGGQAVFHFEGFDTVEAAARLRGLEVQIPLDRRAKLDAGNYYVSDLIGCEVWESGAVEALGAVRDVELPGGVPLLAVQTQRGEVLIPLASDICVRIDMKSKRIDVSLPEGLLNLNRPE